MKQVSMQTAVHPRMCGEHAPAFLVSAYLAGSSPHVRGTLLVMRVNEARFRFIPACAGNTSVPPKYSTVLPVHPRMCGEHIVLFRQR